MLKSPTKIEYEFSLLNVCSDSVISSMKHDMFWLLLLSLGGLYIFPNVILFMGKAHKNCIIGQQFCLHHITGTAFIIRLKLYVYIVENSETFQKIYSFMQFK